VAKDADAVEAARRVLESLAERFADALRTSIVGAKVRTASAEIRLVAPEPPQMARFRRLGFGDDVEEPAYRGLPTYQRAGVYADPFYYYYYDPYYDLTNWLLLDTLLRHQYAYAPMVHVVDPRGAELFTADAAPADGLWGSDAISFDRAGELVVDQTIPDAADNSGFGESFDPGGSSADAGWGSDSGGGGDGGGGSCSSGASCSSSSCGSSCSSGSSCGSSCGSSD
jgi:hypothetical protein